MCLDWFFFSSLLSIYVSLSLYLYGCYCYFFYGFFFTFSLLLKPSVVVFLFFVSLIYLLLIFRIFIAGRISLLVTLLLSSSFDSNCLACVAVCVGVSVCVHAAACVNALHHLTHCYTFAVFFKLVNFFPVGL